MTCARRSAFQSPVGAGALDLADDQLDDAVEQVVLVPDVAVERHRVDAELLAELAHAQRLEAVAIGELDRRPGARGRGSSGARRSARVGAASGHHLLVDSFVCGRSLTSLRRSAMFTA